MWTGHLSRFLFGPPGPELQKLNAILHTEPYATIAYMTYWSFFLLIFPPIAGIAMMWMLIYEMIRHFAWKRRRIEPKGMSNTELAVVITGCDTGFGRELVFRLAAEGFVVFAGCLDKESHKQFAGESRIQPVAMDVTKQEQVDEVYKIVKKWLSEADKGKKRYFHALINNAGVGKIGYVDWCDMSFYKVCMEVNCFAQIRTTKAFLPILKQQAIDKSYGDSQIVNVVSMAGMLSAGGWAATAYEVSKNAAEAFTDGLRLEMKMFGVKVVSVNPSMHQTPLIDENLVEQKAREELWEPMDPSLKQEYGQEFFESYMKHVATTMTISRWDFKVVVDSMVDCVQSSEPPAQLIIGSDAKYTMVFMRMLPQWCRHLMVQTLMPEQVPAMLKASKQQKETEASDQ